VQDFVNLGGFFCVLDDYADNSKTFVHGKSPPKSKNSPAVSDRGKEYSLGVREIFPSPFHSGRTQMSQKRYCNFNTGFNTFQDMLLFGQIVNLLCIFVPDS
jgi:hypothetical protein